MKHTFRKIFITLTFTLSLGLTIGLTSHKKEEILEAKAETVEQYYSSITDGMSGDTLKNALHSLNNTKRKKTVGYAGMRQFAATCDADPDGSGKIIGFYDNQKVGPAWDSGNTWNREHVWPNVRGGSSVEDDAHMTRPASTKTNGDRGSKGYGMTSYDPGQFVAYYRGAAARIIFYAAIADTNLNLIDDPLNYHGGNPANSMGSLSEMLAWNLQYLPSDTSFTGADDLARRTELNRNEKIQNASGGQGNRNPFIDHPEYACKIWGNYSEATKKACSGSYVPVTSSVSLDKTSIDLYVDDTATLSATSSDGSNITWSVKASAIASLDKTSTSSGQSVTITAKGKGTTKVTATNGEGVSAECTINVSEKPVIPEDPYLEINKTEITMNVGESETISGTCNTGNISWFANNTNVEIDKDTTTTGQNVTITAVKAGESTLTACDDYGNIKTCRITINGGSEQGGSESEPGGNSNTESQNGGGSPQKTGISIPGCGGYIGASSAVIFVTSIMGVVFLVRRRKEK